MHPDRLLKTAFMIVCAIIFIGGAVLVVRGDVIPMVVLSGSMGPEMMPGDMILVTPQQPEQIAVGDIISFWGQSEERRVIVTHRVIGIDQERGLFTVKGDNNPVMDQNPVKYGDLVGRAVTLVPFLGLLVTRVRQMIMFLVFIPAAIIVVSEIRMVITNPVLLLKRERAQRKHERLPVKINYWRLGTIFILAFLPFWILAFPSIGTNPDLIGREETKYGQGNTITIQGEGFVSQIYVIRNEGKPVIPGYGRVSPGKSVKVSIQDPGSTTVSMAPAVVPIFWAVNLASVHPAFPALVIGLLPGFLILLALSPLWIGKRKVHSKKKRRRLPFGSSIV
jgi:signal peptidase